MKKTVAVALSGGLDSTLAAALLKKENNRVIGVHFQTGYEFPPGESIQSRPLSSAVTRAEMAAQKIGIPIEVIDCSQPFEKEVVHYFIRTYHTGRTPNPCIVCNQCIKFGFVLDHAKTIGASILATGHYARIRQGSSGEICLLKGADRAKDQSYFLARLSQRQLSQAMFPLGTYTKQQVTEMASARGLRSFMEGESQELCFVRHDSYKDFLSNLAGFPCTPGPIVNTRGDLLGHHRGLHAYTVGQRRGIGIPGPEPYYVIRLDNKQNRLVIGLKSALASTKCTVTHINWIGITPPVKPISVQTRIRYRHQEAESILTPVGHDAARVSFTKAQYAITPGQGAVFYQGERVLGGGWIA